MTLTNIERATIALFNEQEDIATLYTYNQKLIKRFDNTILPLKHLQVF